MARVRARGEDIRKFILGRVESHSTDIAKVTAERFGITRQAVSKHLKRLVSENALAESGNTRNRSYRLASLSEWHHSYRIEPGLAEDVVWRADIQSRLLPLPENAVRIWHYGFTEMFNNVLDHSAGASVTVSIRKRAVDTQMAIIDDGVGIFAKIQTALGLLDERHAVLELTKGKLTTDPSRHSGEGIFFTSRMFDRFGLLSGGVCLFHRTGQAEDWILERHKSATGTAVLLELSNHTFRTTRQVFDEFASGEDYGFNKTVVPVRLAQYGSEQLVSRSQAKRLLGRVELFKIVIFDFTGVPGIGQAFADEIFRVFAQQHPEIELRTVKANSEVKRMIQRAQSRLEG
jgi:anti-sigma regulatory factor (Ser/Thr protein kinase)